MRCWHLISRLQLATCAARMHRAEALHLSLPDAKFITGYYRRDRARHTSSCPLFSCLLVAWLRQQRTIRGHEALAESAAVRGFFHSRTPSSAADGAATRCDRLSQGLPCHACLRGIPALRGSACFWRTHLQRADPRRRRLRYEVFHRVDDALSRLIPLASFSAVPLQAARPHRRPSLLNALMLLHQRGRPNKSISGQLK
jgi:hypothetical protein